jgi:hypothetical protein
MSKQGKKGIEYGSWRWKDFDGRIIYHPFKSFVTLNKKTNLDPKILGGYFVGDVLDKLQCERVSESW